MSNYDIAALIRAKKRREKFGKWVQNFIARQIGLAVAALISGWFLMLGVGVIHADWVHALPTVGYWHAVLVVWLLRGVLSDLPPAKKDQS